MIGWLLETVLMVVFGIVLGIFLGLIFRRIRRCKNLSRTLPAVTAGTSPDSPRWNNPSRDSFRFFRWEDQPTLIREASDFGWPRFAFTTLMSSASFRLARHSSGGGDNGNYINAEVGWEVPEGSADYMQRVRLNPGMKNIFLTGAITVIRAARPLPGPQTGNSSFPEEAYFEITILPGEDDKPDKDKPVEEDFKDSHGGKPCGKNDEVLLSVGLTGGGSLPLKVPGSYHGSTGFDSTGSVYFDGNKLVLSRNDGGWGRLDQVIGCGYNPIQKRVFYTVNSELVHEIHCSSPEFGHPLYPALASNADVTVRVNLGQSAFKYTPANLHRAPNPCLLKQHVESTTSYSSDDMFSIGRIDSQWRQLSAARISGNAMNGTKCGGGGAEVVDPDSDADLFEIVLDVSGRSLQIKRS